MSTEPRVPVGRLRTTRDQPDRPALTTRNHAPVVAHVPPPLSVRASQLLWILSLAAGGVGVGYAFIVRKDLLDVIGERVLAIDPGRAEETVTLTSDILYWSLFGGLVAVLLVQLVFLVSFANRRPRARWWLFGSMLLHGGLLVVAVEFAALETSAEPLRLILLAQLGLAALGLLVSLIPAALRWTARGVDIRRGPEAVGTGDL